jgi:16S rRNA (cytosine1402-N4)-methyltransferase
MTGKSDNQGPASGKGRRFGRRRGAPAGDAGPTDPGRGRRGTPAGTHVPVLLREVIGALAPRGGEVVADCTLGYGGHAAAFARAVQPGGRVIGLDVDAGELERTRRRLEAANLPVSVHNANFAGLARVLAEAGLDGFDIIFADLGVSSMQIDDPGRGMSYKHDDAPLDMRMDPSLGRTAADVLMTISQADLSRALWELADEPDHEKIAEWIVRQRAVEPFTTTGQLKSLIFAAKGTVEKLWKRHAAYEDAHPAMRTFQALRMLVNDELSAVKELLRQAPQCLRAGGRIGIISFHSGEDRLVKNAFRDGYSRGVYEAYSGQAVRPDAREVSRNPRCGSARFRWARVGGQRGHVPKHQTCLPAGR